MHSVHEQIPLSAGQTFRLLRWAGGVDKVEVFIGPDRRVPLQGEGDHWHYHRATELTLVQHGAGTRFVADSIEPFEDGDLVLIGPNVPHYLLQVGASAGISIQWEFPDEHGIWSFAEAAGLRSLTGAAQLGLHLTGATATAIRRLMEDLLQQGGLARIGIFLQILARINEAPRRDLRRLASISFSVTRRTVYDECMRKAVSSILAHFREPIYLDELLRITGMSRPTFVRRFREHTGKSFKAFLVQVRLTAVGRALRDTDESIVTAALSNGFNQLAYFNRAFRAHFGMTPTEYRAKKGRMRGPNRFAATALRRMKS